MCPREGTGSRGRARATRVATLQRALVSRQASREKKAPPGGGTDLDLLACSIAETECRSGSGSGFKTNERADASLLDRSR